MKKTTYNIVTFGCQMNERDSETLAGFLEELGFTYEEDKLEAQVVVLNTCSVRENADKRFFGVL
ncbi:MAG: tRNA (N6-isopentenyl adenosine(37)-C2)-methylthiotransferase MiaB, partial [Firmicutes bacterium]|nr:tRNA (N6-isopentenyl adenosine(37)-C2)-methylthiotransferase MiaB [Bacillota bacterium]